VIDFTPAGTAEVHFDIASMGKTGGRREVRLSLEAFLLLVKTSETIEALRAAVFMWEPGKAAKAAV
jgi:hypothetical protein